MAALSFNANEIFEIAKQIERNGAGFYRKAAGLAGDKDVAKVLEDLASMEDAHLATFDEMQQAVSDAESAPTVFDPDNEAAMYLQALADKRVFDTSVDPSEVLTGDEKPALVFRTAIGLEKDSVIFYLGVRDLVPPKLGKDKIDKIIAEEMRHITVLSRNLAAVS